MKKLMLILGVLFFIHSVSAVSYWSNDLNNQLLAYCNFDEQTGTTNIDKIKALSPTCYHFSSSSGLDTQNEYCGFLAGEVKKVIPEAVKTKQDVKYEQKLTKKGKTTEEDEYETVEVPTGTTTDSLDDRAIIITLVNAVKEQQAQIEQLQAEVARLEGKKVDKT